MLHCDRFGHQARCAIRDHVAGGGTQDMVEAQGQRVLFTDVATVLVDDCQAIRIGILAEANGGV